MLAGGRYLVDFDEITPPMILMLLAPVAEVSPADRHRFLCRVRRGHLPAGRAPSLWLAAPVIAWCLPGPRAGHRVALLAIAAVLALEPGFRFGQREHLIVLLLLPDCCGSRRAKRGGPRRWTAGRGPSLVLAAVAVLIKPYYFLIPAVFLVARLCRVRTWRTVLVDWPAAIFRRRRAAVRPDGGAGLSRLPA